MYAGSRVTYPVWARSLPMSMAAFIFGADDHGHLHHLVVYPSARVSVLRRFFGHGGFLLRVESSITQICVAEVEIMRPSVELDVVPSPRHSAVGWRGRAPPQPAAAVGAGGSAPARHRFSTLPGARALDDLHRRRDDRAAWHEQQRLVQSLIARAPKTTACCGGRRGSISGPATIRPFRRISDRAGAKTAGTSPNARSPSIQTMSPATTGRPVHGQLRAGPGRREGAVAGHGGQIPRSPGTGAGAQPRVRIRAASTPRGAASTTSCRGRSAIARRRRSTFARRSSSIRMRCAPASTWPAHTSTATAPRRPNACSTRWPPRRWAATTPPEERRAKAIGGRPDAGPLREAQVDRRDGLTARDGRRRRAAG